MAWELDASMASFILPTVEWALKCETLRGNRSGWLVEVLLTQLSDGYGDKEWQESESPIWGLFTAEDFARLAVATDAGIECGHVKPLHTVDRPETHERFAIDALTWLLWEHIHEHEDDGLVELIAEHAGLVATTTSGAYELYLDEGGWISIPWYEENEAILWTNDGEQVLRYIWPGGYPLVYITHDGGELCPTCVEQNLAQCCDENGSAGWRVTGHDVNYEDPELYCDHCGERIESAYAEPHEVHEPYADAAEDHFLLQDEQRVR